MILRILVLWLCLCYSSSKATCLTDTEGLCTPGVTVTEDTQVDITEEDLGTEIVTTTTTTVTTTTTTVTNEDSTDILDGTNGYVNSSKEGDMDIDWGGQGPASMPTGNNCYGLGADKCAAITGSGNSTSSMGVDGMGTTFIQTVDISDLNIQKGGEVRYTIEVDKQDAQDRIYMHITGLNGSNQVFTGTDVLSETGVASGYQSYNGTFGFAGVLNRLTIEVGGRDINLAVGPVFDDVTVNVFYNVVNTIITQQITTLEEIYYLDLFTTSEIEFAQEIFEFNDVSTNDIGDIEFMPIEPEFEEITYETVEAEIEEFEMEFTIELEASFDMEFVPVSPMEMLPPPDMQMEMPVNIETVTMEIEMEMELDLPMPEMEDLPPPPDMIASAEDMPPPMEDMPPPPEMEETPPPMETEQEPVEIETEDTPPPMEETKEEPVVEETNEEEPTKEEPEPDSETTEKPVVEPEDSEEQEEVQQEETEKPEKPVKEPSAKEKAATKIVKKIDDKARYDESNQMKTLIVMQILGNTKTFFDTQSIIQDTNVSEYLNKTLEDNYGILFDMAQGQIMEEMINDQY
mgnify:CR=1 FL=1